MQCCVCPRYSEHLIWWFKRHWHAVIALFRYKNDKIFLGENDQKMSKALLKNFPQFAVKPRPPGQSSICIFYVFGAKCQFNPYGTGKKWPFPNSVKNDKKPRVLENPKNWQFEHLSQNNKPPTTFWPILSPIGSKKVHFFNFWKNLGFPYSNLTKSQIRPFWPTFGPKNLVLVTFYLVKIIF